MNKAISKMKEAGLFDEQDVQEAVNMATQEAVPIIAQATVSPDNVNKKVGLYKQSVANNIMNVGGGVNG